jgi:iron-sulfur cluster repair protein YtfE (RIC family)
VNALKLLKEQHDEVSKLFERYESSEDDGDKRQIFEELADNLAAHAEIEEKIFYPAVYVGDLKDLLREAVEEHLSVKRVLADLMDLPTADETFDAKMKALKGQVEHHVEEEEGELFPKVKKNFTSSELDSLGQQMEAMFDELLESEPRQKVPAETDHAPRLE